MLKKETTKDDERKKINAKHKDGKQTKAQRQRTKKEAT